MRLNRISTIESTVQPFSKWLYQKKRLHISHFELLANERTTNQPWRMCNQYFFFDTRPELAMTTQRQKKWQQETGVVKKCGLGPC